MNRSESIAALAAALAAAQGELKHAPKDSVGHVGKDTKTRYADLATCWDAASAALTKHKLAVIQGPSADGARVTVTTLLTHGSGEWVEESLTLLARDASPQAVGSAITYARRYGLCAMVGISPDDDDGAAAQPSPVQTNGRASVQAPKPLPEPGKPVTPLPIAARAAAFGGRLETRGYQKDGLDIPAGATSAEHYLAFMEHTLGPLKNVPPSRDDDCKAATMDYLRRLAAGEFAPQEPAQEEEEI